MLRVIFIIMKIQFFNYLVVFYDVCYEIYMFVFLLLVNFIGLIVYDFVFISKYSRRFYCFFVFCYKDVFIYKVFIDQFILLFNWFGQLMMFFIFDRKSLCMCILQKFCVNIYRRVFLKGKCICCWVFLVIIKKNIVMIVYELKI